MEPIEKYTAMGESKVSGAGHRIRVIRVMGLRGLEEQSAAVTRRIRLY
jgi:hypothetical protein